MAIAEEYQDKKLSFAGKSRLWTYIALGRLTKGTSTKGRKIVTLLCLPLYFLVYPFKFWKTPKVKNFKHELGLCLIIKNEGDYIKEWIDYHRLIGVDIFYIFDNESTDNTLDILKPYIEEGIVKYQLIKGKGRQMDAYNIVINKERKNCRYIGFLDADEFIHLDNGVGLKETLSSVFDKHSDCAAVGLNWLLFGSSNLKNKSNEPVIKRFVYHSEPNFKENKHIKSIVNPRLVMDFRNPHFALYKKGYSAYNLNDGKIHGPFNEDMTNTSIRINHYFTKSEEEFMIKRGKGFADQPGSRNVEEYNYMNRNEIFDDSMLKYAEKLQK